MSKDIKFNLDIKQAGELVKTGLGKLQRYATFLAIVGILLIYSFLVLQISTLSQAEPSEDQVAEQTNTVKRLRIDQNAIDKIEQLEDQNIAVQALFETARDNPFQD
jgi:hypothetical protein